VQTPSVSACQSTRLCKWCDKPFYHKQARVKYCSKRCSEPGKRAEKLNETHCRACGKETWKLSAGGTCSAKCKAQQTGKRRKHQHPKLPCLKCHGLIGLKSKQSARLLRVSHKVVYENRRLLGFRVLTRAEANRSRAIQEGNARPDQWGKRNPSTIEEWQSWAYREDQAEWNAFESEACWSKDPFVKKEIARLAYYRDHETNKAKSRANARATYQKRKHEPEWIQKRRDQQKARHAANPEYKRAWQKDYIKKHPEKVRGWQRKHRSKPINRAYLNLRSRIREVFKSKRSAVSVFGCSKKEFEIHIQSQFTEGMHWNNYGTFWHIDHIIPISHFDPYNEDHKRLANHWTNLRPLEAIANIRRGNRMKETVQIALPF
jgi:hypothetical protein